MMFTMIAFFWRIRPSGVDPTKLFFFTVKLSHFTINNFFSVSNKNASLPAKNKRNSLLAKKKSLVGWTPGCSEGKAKSKLWNFFLYLPLSFWSISSTLNAQILCTKLLFGSFFHLHVTRVKLPKSHLYEKCTLKTLMQLTLT